ncbi:phosphoribosylglycinamide formyltransferase [Aureisphaera galaxeae]|uniref:phosphoribosylglycinamide formyltransferase n=1 Tax=Aureisphaera galaxeae TaxID=1538023 RepID=UPI002350191E|nr:phosphoribosylglycinamide formyltransferase [Aureisphaera galaxeae]MDC8005239.1 phosphoribosylglycinamide formyltransferase [Aureisphaera galaxeae]
MKKRIVVFASGNGTNAQNIIEYFQQGTFAEVVQVLSNNEHAKVLERAKTLKTKASHFTRAELHDENGVLKTLLELQPDLIVLAGFLWMFPKLILAEFPNKVINIHPALLPKYGGKGMYGMNVHKAVVENEEEESGITIHYVNEAYDEGAIICQKKTTLEKEDTPEDVAKKVHALEYEHFPCVIEELLMQESDD